MSFTNPVLFGAGVVSNQSIYEAVTTARHTPGTRACLEDGRTFEYVRSDNGTAIGKGKLATYDPIVAAVDKIAVQAAVAAGATQIPVTVTVTLTKDELAGGYLSIDDDAGEAEMYRITGHAAHTSGTLTLSIDRPVVVALTTSTTATIVFNSCAVKISAAVTAAALPVEVAAGVPLFDVGVGSTTPQFFWIQKTGPADVLFGTAVGAIGQTIIHGEDAGSFQVCVATTAQAVRVSLGTICALLPVDTEYHPVRLNIA
jgi:hypothetical protein